MKIRWTEQAVRNLDAIQTYIETDDPQAAARVALKLIETVEHPGMGRPGRVVGTRELVIAGLPYVIPYRVRGNVVQILRVLHTSMRWPQ